MARLGRKSVLVLREYPKENTPEKRKLRQLFRSQRAVSLRLFSVGSLAGAAALATPAQAVQHHDAETLGALYSRAFDLTPDLTQALGALVSRSTRGSVVGAAFRPGRRRAHPLDRRWRRVQIKNALGEDARLRRAPGA